MGYSAAARVGAASGGGGAAAGRSAAAAMATAEGEETDDDVALAAADGGILRAVSFVLWRVALLNPRRSYDYGAHWRYAQYLRIVMRIILTIFTAAIVVFATWAALQSVQFRFEVFQTAMAKVSPIPDGLKVYTDAFALFMRGNLSVAELEATRRKRSSRYQGMCQRNWFSSAATVAPEADSQSLFMGDMAFFSMLAYVAPFDEVASFDRLFAFYKQHRAGGGGWELQNPLRDVWEPLRQTPMPAEFGAAIEQERVDIVRWSQLHLAQSLRSPFFHFRRSKRPATASAASAGDSATSEGGDGGGGDGYVHLFVVRGTEMSFAADFWQNIIVFADVFLIEQLANFVPCVGLVPIEFIRDLVSATNFIARPPDAFYYHVHLHKYMRAVQLLYDAHDEVTAAVGANAGTSTTTITIEAPDDDQETLLRENDPVAVAAPATAVTTTTTTTTTPSKSVHVRGRSDYVCAGHSLGGVGCQLASPSLKIPAIAFSAPGSLLMSRKFNLGSEATEAFVTNVVVTNDIIPLIGTLNGEVHNVLCEHGSSLICHSVQLTFWRTMQHCDVMRRKFGDLAMTYQMEQSEMVKQLHRLNRFVERIVGFKLHFGDY